MTRRFQVWEYMVSHRQLLLRSVATETHPRRAEILFKGVSYLELLTDLEIDRITPMTSAETAPVNRSPVGLALTDDQRVWRLESPTGVGFVVALAMFSTEDDLASGDSSSLPTWPMRSDRTWAEGQAGERDSADE